MSEINIEKVETSNGINATIKRQELVNVSYNGSICVFYSSGLNKELPRLEISAKEETFHIYGMKTIVELKAVLEALIEILG